MGMNGDQAGQERDLTSWSTPALEVAQRAFNGRAGELEDRKRLPRGYSVRDLRTEIAYLEAMALDCARELNARGHRIDIGERIPVAHRTAAGEDPAA